MSRRWFESMFFLRWVIPALLWMPFAGVAEEPDTTAPVVTQMECSPAEAAIARLYDDSGLSGSVEVCAGVGNTSLVVVGANEGAWIDILKPVSTESSVIYDLRPGNFPTVATQLNDDMIRLEVEWIRDPKNKPIALIFPVNAMDPDSDAQTAEVLRYFVVRLPSDNACVLGAVASKDEARALAGSSARCVETASD